MPQSATLSLSESDFLYMQYSCGATIAFDNEGQDISAQDVPAGVHVHGGSGAVGTLWLNTCIGVYFPLDKNRCFLAHINASSQSERPNNAVDEAEGREIREMVCKRLLQESETMHWNIFDSLYASTIVVCAPNKYRKWGDGRVKLVGYYVVKGIRDFLKEHASFLLQESYAALDRAREESGLDCETASVLLDDVQGALCKPDGEARRGVLEQARESAELSIAVKDKSTSLLAQAAFKEKVGAHGFLVRQRAGEGKLLKWVSHGRRFRDWAVDTIPSDVLEEGWTAHEVPRED
ncbi:uncharacterized protein LTR77_001995 [Saxophila tyrrhenica]|uniref:Uncharacterized protein n=1 Tax=Saxophila tyrrhenica TaxID=1690608 RepID=A0AAV9PHU1_9PEZI|nr:hypothetical protein LTR77_001995 [Saxophila tyrrhenica]